VLLRIIARRSGYGDGGCAYHGGSRWAPRVRHSAMKNAGKSDEMSHCAMRLWLSGTIGRPIRRGRRTTQPRAIDPPAPSRPGGSVIAVCRTRYRRMQNQSLPSFFAPRQRRRRLCPAGGSGPVAARQQADRRGPGPDRARPLLTPRRTSYPAGGYRGCSRRGAQHWGNRLDADHRAL
jgi:hypothetical protein